MESPLIPSTVASCAASRRIALRLRSPTRQVGDDEMSSDVRWIRSYGIHESDGGLGTFCIYQASSPEKIREHAARAGIPASDIFEVADTVIVRPDPVAVAA